LEQDSNNDGGGGSTADHDTLKLDAPWKIGLLVTGLVLSALMIGCVCCAANHEYHICDCCDRKVLESRVAPAPDDYDNTGASAPAWGTPSEYPQAWVAYSDQPSHLQMTRYATSDGDDQAAVIGYPIGSPEGPLPDQPHHGEPQVEPSLPGVPATTGHTQHDSQAEITAIEHTQRSSQVDDSSEAGEHIPPPTPLEAPHPVIPSIDEAGGHDLPAALGPAPGSSPDNDTRNGQAHVVGGTVAGAPLDPAHGSATGTGSRGGPAPVVGGLVTGTSEVH
jgi:hypothetical protein